MAAALTACYTLGYNLYGSTPRRRQSPLDLAQGGRGRHRPWVWLPMFPAAGGALRPALSPQFRVVWLAELARVACTRPTSTLGSSVEAICTEGHVIDDHGCDERRETREVDLGGIDVQIVDRRILDVVIRRPNSQRLTPCVSVKTSTIPASAASS